jgi:hypothetical protein
MRSLAACTSRAAENWWPATTGLGLRRRPGLPQTLPKGRRAVTGPGAASPGAGTGAALPRPPQPCLDGDGAVRRPGDGAVVLGAEQGNSRREEEGRPVLVRRGQVCAALATRRPDGVREKEQRPARCA